MTACRYLKRRLKLGKILLALIVLLVAFLLFERFRGQISARYKRELAAGEKLTPQDLATTFSLTTAHRHEKHRAAANGAKLPNTRPHETHAGGKGDRFKEDEWWTTVTNRWEQVALTWKANKSARADSRRVAQTHVEQPAISPPV